MRRRGFQAPLLVALMVTAFASTVGASPTLAATPAFSIRSVAWPANFRSSDEGGRDRYTLLIENVGGAPSTGTITVTDTLPAGMETSEFRVAESRNPSWQCTENADRTEVMCTRSALGSLEEASIEIPVQKVPASGPGSIGSVMNTATITEAGGSTVATGEPSTLPNTVNESSPSFGVRDFSFSVTNGNAAPDEQAGDHPNAVTTSFDLDLPASFYANEHAFESTEEVKEVVVDLPLGFVGDPQAAARCSFAELAKGTSTISGCPVGSRVGTFGRQNFETGLIAEQGAPIFNMVPEDGYPAEFAMYAIALQKWVVLYASVVHSDAGYSLQVRVPGILRAALVAGVSLTFFGDPAEHDGGGTAPAAFFANPVDCSAPAESLEAAIHVDSWQSPGRLNADGSPDLSDPNWKTATSQTYPQITGCDLLQFNPTIGVQPEETQTDTPSGYEVDLKVPQAANLFPVPATPDLEDATVTLPAGVSISPSAADGLQGCAEAQIGLSSTVPGSCPAASQIGTVEVETPLLPAHTLTGHVFLAQPKCGGAGQLACREASATNGELYGLYLEVEGAGVLIKLQGKVEANTATGQLTTTFAENPQLPFSELRLKLTGGATAPLANPQTCGTFTATSELEPWSAPVTPDATPSSSFPITGCAGSLFAPSFSAGTVTPLAGAFSPFTLTFLRHDGEQDLSGLTVTTPPGLLGKIAGVPQCPEAQANAGTCGPESQIGTTTVASGSGSAPLYLTGRVYLTGPYDGQPFGLSIVVPAVAGPFNLGNVVVRASIAINPHTAAITATSQPLPQIIHGVPTRIQTVNVTLNRPGFMFNPTNCDQQAVTGTIISARGAAENVSSPFAVANCANLAFKPGFSASTSGQASKAGGASLDVKVSYPNGPFGAYANVKSVKVDLPKQLPSRLSTLHLACVAATFETNPANCPPESNVGMATASTPVLNAPLRGPAYIVSYGNEKFPNLEIVLQGEGITLILEGNTQIKNGITSSTFKTVPDAPVSNFELKLPTGKYSILGADVPQSAKYSLCGQSLAMPTAITGQNGAVIKQSTKIAVAGCSRTKTVLTRAQKLTKALKACRTKQKGKRAGCEKQARKQYAPAKVEVKKKHNKQHK
jgi:uncharacterized repeat protein (TIGR01451 family)